MKKVQSLLFVALCLVFDASFGQNSRKLEMGFNLGPNISSLRGNDILDQYHSSKISLSSGLFVQYNLNQLFSLFINPIYDNKGSKIKEREMYDDLGNVIGVGKGTTNFHYLSLPILLRMDLGTDQMFFLNAGPYLSYLIKQTFKIKMNNGSTNTEDNTENNKRTDFGISLGGGIKFPLSKKCNLFFEIRENLGLINVSAVRVSNDGSIKTNTINLLFGISYKPN
jgi:hypothetical protein